MSTLKLMQGMQIHEINAQSINISNLNTKINVYRKYTLLLNHSILMLGNQCISINVTMRFRLINSE